MPIKTKSIKFILVSLSLALVSLFSFSLFRHIPTVHAAGIITVTDQSDVTANDGKCTLREAITAANNDTTSGAAPGECAAGSGTDTINFTISGTPDFTNGGQDGYTIAPQSALPSITEQVTINGYSQPGSLANTAVAPNPLNGRLLIEIDGAGAGVASGIVFQDDSNGSAVRGIVVNNYDELSALLVLADNIEIQGNYIGTNPAGSSAKPNQVGITAFVQDPESGHDALVGGLNAADRNLISGNTAGTVGTASYPGEGWTFQGNYIGVAADGLSPIVNSTIGGSGAISVDDVTNVTIGGSNPTAINVFGASLGHGIAPHNADDLVVEGNYVGYGYDGTTVLGNTNTGGGNGFGLAVTSCEGYILKDNRIAGYIGEGIYLGDGNAQGLVQGNSITESAKGIVANGTDSTDVIENDIQDVTESGIVALDNQDFTITGNTVSATAQGIRVGDDSVGILVSDNTVSDVSSFGLGLYGDNISADITGNTISAAQDGIMVYNDINALIEDNEIHDNSESGIEISNSDGTLELRDNVVYANGEDGIFVTSTSNLLIEENSIYDNEGRGIGTYYSPSYLTGTKNSIYDNGELGIDLGADGVTNNDSLDPDVGSNNLLNYPNNLEYYETGGNTDMTYSLDVPAGDYRVEFFSNATADPSGHGEGETFLGYQNITSTGSGSQNFNHTLTGISHDNIAATATLIDDGAASGLAETSEFSAVATEYTPPDPVADVSITKTLTDPQNVAPGETIHYELTLVEEGDADIDLGQFDGGGVSPFASSVFIDFLPPELTLVGSSNPDLTCVDSGTTLLDYVAASHTDWHAILCFYTGSGQILSQGESISTSLAVTVAPDSDLTFTNYALAPLIDSDPDAAAVGAALAAAFNGGGNPDLVTYLADNPNDNFAAAAFPAPVDPDSGGGSSGGNSGSSNGGILAGTGQATFLLVGLASLLILSSGVVFSKRTR